ncbi:MAG TPA: FemAB family PEP-CTERM system-associated protein [Thauera sp.]|uniref:FemAB family XrtA/PEP-CTERM system-associated protein n=1 Tax=Thauera sp. TaxID=1905334 RepID=UPI002B929FE3|nr:FemAB family XrtA/PEP-CTERM system-associated protein [Thauera sp.]HRV77583.1 FemAB family PEP-CTERM system-associated protein [Thauera sp.]
MDRLPIVVNLLKGEDAPRWDDFVRRCPQATFFHLSAWRDLMEEVFDHRTFYLYAERAGDIVGVLPLAEVRSRLFGHALVSLPFCVYGGIATAEDAGPETLHALESKAETLAQALGVQHLEYRNLQPRHEEWPRQAELYVTFRKEILPEVEANLLAIPRKQRAMVRKGIKNALVSEVDDTVDRFFALYADNVLRHGTPALPKRFFEQLKERFGEACEVLTVSSPEGKPLSSVLSFYFRDEVLPYYAGDDLAARELAANDFKYWELMRRACERGCKVFDYGRSKVGTGPYAFKKNWGFEPQPLSYEYRLYKRDSIPQNNPMNPKYRAFIALWKRLPIGVANRLGPHIVRNLG